MSRVLKIVSFALAALVVTGLAIVMKISHLKSGVVSTGKTEVQLNVTVRGTGGRAVRNARVSVFDPDQIVLGKTNDSGVLVLKALMSSGRSLILQVDGIAFKMQRTILIPRSIDFRSSVFFDLAEVHEGNATLISTANTETASLVNKPTPIPLTLDLNTQNLKISDESKKSFADLVNFAALQFEPAKKSHARCQSWDSATSPIECELFTSDGKSYSRLFSSLPNTEPLAQAWLKEFFEPVHNVYPKKLEKNDFLFVIRHFNQRYRAYFAGKPLQVWKQKKDSHILRVKLKTEETQNEFSELALITEDGRLLQRKITFPVTKRVFTIRIPNENRIELSKRSPTNLLAR